MSAPTDDLYLEINKLLEDVFKFLQNQDTLTRLLPNQRTLADSLITRCKVQLQEISKFTDYVDMQQEKTPEKTLPLVKSEEGDGDEEEVYNLIDETIRPDVSPNSDLPFKNIKGYVKCGELCWKVKVLLNFSKMKRIYAVVYNNSMLIYNSEKDSRPAECIDLKYFEACEINSNLNNKNVLFEVKSTTGDVKYLFSSVAYKDMIQWVTQINKIHDSLIMKSKSSSSMISPEPIIANNDTNSLTSDEESAEDLYVDVDQTIVPPKQSLPIKPPDLPYRPINVGGELPALPVLPPPPEKEEETDEEIYDVPIIGQPAPKIAPAPPPAPKIAYAPTPAPKIAHIPAPLSPTVPAPPFDDGDSFSDDDEEEEQIYNVFVTDQRTSQTSFSSFKPPPIKSKKPEFTRIQSKKIKRP